MVSSSLSLSFPFFFAGTFTVPILPFVGILGTAIEYWIDKYRVLHLCAHPKRTDNTFIRPACFFSLFIAIAVTFAYPYVHSIFLSLLISFVSLGLVFSIHSLGLIHCHAFLARFSLRLGFVPSCVCLFTKFFSLFSLFASVFLLFLLEMVLYLVLAGWGPGMEGHCRVYGLQQIEGMMNCRLFDVLDECQGRMNDVLNLCLPAAFFCQSRLLSSVCLFDCPFCSVPLLPIVLVQSSHGFTGKL